MDEDQREPHWRQTTTLAKTTFLAVLAIILIAVFLAQLLDNFSLLGFPLGFFFIATAAPLLLAALGFWFIRRQDAIDRQYGASEEI